ncbi:MAG: NAD-binding protein [Propionibacteriaceae bacterium]|nr:NAD-binding protein [Propionibacteriaceae bacterium]
MGNPLVTMLTTRDRVRRQVLRRRSVSVPTEVPGTDAVFLVLRRMRLPLIVLISIFTISVVGMSLMPGVDPDGNPHRLTIFDAFYLMSITATTIGFGEVPYGFSYPQRMWVTASIYMTVIGWAYALSSLFAMVQDRGFREAITVQRLRRRIKGISEPFLIVAGYGQAGRAVARVLDEHHRRFVVIDHSPRKVDTLAIDQHSEDVPGIEGDVHNPALLGLAGLGHPLCEGVLALTTDDCNLAITMNVHLLRPDVPVIARCDDRRTATRLADFDPAAIINPYDRYGHYLGLALKKPATFQLATWLMDPVGSPLVARMPGLTDGRWIVVGDGRFSTEVANDLTAIGLEVTVADPMDGNPDVTGVTGMIAGAESDVENLALAAHARLENPDIFLAVRQRSNLQAATMQAFAADSLFVPSELVAREVLAHIISPDYWAFIDHVLHADDPWSEDVLRRFVDRVGGGTPTSTEFVLDSASAPAVARWFAGGRSLTVGQLTADPDDWLTPLPLLVVSLIRDEETTFLPDDDTALQAGDLLVIAADPDALDQLDRTLFHDRTLHYTATGEVRPETWLFRYLADLRKTP